MMASKSYHIKFDLENDVERAASGYLVSMDRNRFKTYSAFVAEAIVHYMEPEKHISESEEIAQFSKEIQAKALEVFESALQEAVNIYLADLLQRLSGKASDIISMQNTNAVSAVQPPPIAPTQEELKPMSPEDIDWGFINGE